MDKKDVIFPLKNGGNLKKIASCIFVGGNVVLWGDGAISLASGWGKVLGSSIMLGVNACYYFGNNKPKWNIAGHGLSILGMFFINQEALFGFRLGAMWGMGSYTLSRSAGIFASSSMAEYYEKSTSSIKQEMARKASGVMLAFGVVSRFSMIYAAIQSHDWTLAGVLLSWNVADAFLSVGPQRPTSRLSYNASPKQKDI